MTATRARTQAVTHREPGRAGCSVLLLDLGGTVFRSPLELLADFADQHRSAAAPARRAGPFGTDPDPMWRAVRRGELSEHGYWSARATEFGAVLGHPRWTARDLMAALFATCPDLIRPAAAHLIEHAHHAGIPVGALTNDLRAFHGEHTGQAESLLAGLRTVVDGSVTGIRKPDPRAYAAAITALDTSPADVVFVDDLPGNVTGARACGLTGIELDLRRPDRAFGRARAALGLPPDVGPPATARPLPDGLRGGTWWPPSWAPLGPTRTPCDDTALIAQAANDRNTSGGTR